MGIVERLKTMLGLTVTATLSIRPERVHSVRATDEKYEAARARFDRLEEKLRRLDRLDRAEQDRR